MFRNFFSKLSLLFMKGGVEDMIIVYVTLIIYNRRTYESVPENLQPAVKEELLVMGLGTDGKPLA